jgi:uncharacterized YkwD family protein
MRILKNRGGAMKEFFKRNYLVILFVTFLLIVICAIYSKTFAYTYEALDFKYGKVTVSCLNIRCGPGITYTKVGKIYKDDYISVFAKVGDWYIIQTDSNIIGAVHGDYIEAVYDENEVQNAQMNSKNQSQTEENNVTETVSMEETTVSNDDIELTEDEKDFLELINANRVNNGLDKLEIDMEIENVARLKAKDLNENNYFAHTSPTYGDISSMFKTFGIEAVSNGENIAGNKTLVGAVEAWMNSENHKSNILNSDFNYTGVAVVENNNYGKIFVEIFAQK